MNAVWIGWIACILFFLFDVVLFMYTWRLQDRMMQKGAERARRLIQEDPEYIKTQDNIQSISKRMEQYNPDKGLSVRMDNLVSNMESISRDIPTTRDIENTIKNIPLTVSISLDDIEESLTPSQKGHIAKKMKKEAGAEIDKILEKDTAIYQAEYEGYVDKFLKANEMFGIQIVDESTCESLAYKIASAHPTKKALVKKSIRDKLLERFPNAEEVLELLE